MPLIALYPDPLLAQVLTASTYWDQIPEAATWADQHSYLMGDALAAAIQEDHLTWDPSILALLPFPSVLDMMASDPAWTQQLGNAVLTERDAVMDAVQRMRHKAKEFGYLQPNSYDNVVDDGGYIEILPVIPGVVYVPQYDPLVVFARPAHGLVIGGAIRFGPGSRSVRHSSRGVGGGVNPRSYGPRIRSLSTTGRGCELGQTVNTMCIPTLPRGSLDLASNTTNSVNVSGGRAKLALRAVRS